MTQEQILEYKRMCAVILGYKNKGMKNLEMWVSKKTPNGVNTNELQFDSDWNLIMEVVEAIEKVNFTELPDFSCFCVVVKDNRCIIEQHPQFALVYEELSDSFHNSNPYVIGDSKKEAVIQAIYQFLLWYYGKDKKSLTNG